MDYFLLQKTSLRRSNNVEKIILIIVAIGSINASRCGYTYTIKSNDTLSSIASKVYNNPNKWNIIYLKNKNIIGSKPNNLKIDSKIYIPCINRINFINDIEKNNKNALYKIDILSNEWPPYKGKNLPNGGMLIDITKEVFKLIPDTTYTISWTTDIPGILNTFLKSHKYDLSPGWYKPNCNNIDNVPDDQKIRCEYKFSDPMYEDLIVFFKNKQDLRPLKSFKDLKNKTICQPKGYLLFNYKKYGLINGKNFQLLKVENSKICMEKLRDRLVDYVAINKNEGDKVISELGLSNNIISDSNSPMITRTIHFIIHKTHPLSDTLIFKINKALKELRTNGKLYNIQTKHIINFQNSLK